MERLDPHMQRILTSLNHHMGGIFAKPSLKDIRREVSKLYRSPSHHLLSRGMLCHYWEVAYYTIVTDCSEKSLRSLREIDELSEGFLLLTRHCFHEIMVPSHILRISVDNRDKFLRELHLLNQRGSLSHVKEMQDGFLVKIHSWDVLCSDGNIRNLREDELIEDTDVLSRKDNQTL